MKAIARRRRMDRKIVERLRAGDGTNKIARELSVSKKRVVELRRLASEKGFLNPDAKLPAFPAVLFPDIVDKRSQRAAPTDDELLPFKGWIKERIEFGWYPITVWEELPITVPRSNFYRFINRHKLRKKGSRYRVIPEIVSAPGESLQLDWGKLRTVEIDGKRRTLWMLIAVLGYSRFMTVRLVWRADVETTLDALSSIFEELGGVPEKVTTDNAKCFSILASKYEPLLNPVAERFAAHYGCIIECLPPYQPQKKGKVERQVGYVRRLYEAHGDDWWGLEESQHYLDKKLSIANQRKHGTTGLKPIEVFQMEEKQTLKPLPLQAYEIEEYHSGTVRKDGCIRFRGKYYGVGEQYAGTEVRVIGNRSQVSIYHNGVLLEVYERLYDLHKSKAIKPHLRSAWEKTFQDDSYLRKRAQGIGEWVEEMTLTILAEGNGFIDFRRIWGILSLDKKYPHRIINEACRIACEHERWSYRAVLEFAEHLQTVEQPLPEARTQLSLLKAPKFTHDISQYSTIVELTLIKGGKGES